MLRLEQRLSRLASLPVAPALADFVRADSAVAIPGWAEPAAVAVRRQVARRSLGSGWGSRSSADSHRRIWGKDIPVRIADAAAGRMADRRRKSEPLDDSHKVGVT
mgnify:CR=1 FL=1